MRTKTVSGKGFKSDSKFRFCSEIQKSRLLQYSKLRNFQKVLIVHRKLMEGLRCIDDFTLKCLDREHRAYFNTLYAGTTQVIIDLCQEGEYQTGRYRYLIRYRK